MQSIPLDYWGKESGLWWRSWGKAWWQRWWRSNWRRWTGCLKDRNICVGHGGYIILDLFCHHLGPLIQSYCSFYPQHTSGLSINHLNLHPLSSLSCSPSNYSSSPLTTTRWLNPLHLLAVSRRRSIKAVSSTVDQQNVGYFGEEVDEDGLWELGVADDEIIKDGSKVVGG